MTQTVWMPREFVERPDMVAATDALLGREDVPFSEREDVFTVEALGLQWDIGVRVFEPTRPEQIPVDADGKKVGGLFLHGGEDDWRQLVPLAELLVGKLGWKVVLPTFPGRLYLPDASRDWPGDTIHPDGTVRTPIWQDGEFVSPDDYDIIKDQKQRLRDGTRTLARAKPGTRFYHRMAAWPAAMEVGMIEAARRHLPESEYAVYVHGHSTGGPIVSMLSQRIPNCSGNLAAEASPFGYINAAKFAWAPTGKVQGYDRTAAPAKERYDLFNDLYIRTWRDHARYRGPEALAKEGPSALMRLPWLMEEILDEWAEQTVRPRFKCEYLITHNIRTSLVAAAEVSAERLGLDAAGTQALVDRFVGYTEPLSGPDVKPLPPTLTGISGASRDHSPEVYAEVIVPMFEAIEPRPKYALTRYLGGTHKMWGEDGDLPLGIAPAVITDWHDAIVGGWFSA
ncbi:hypothetical protein [Jiangella mangrovi]|uniref:Alpha/beta hydrolase n=1 Tax=Jiangella mangrovi TaxID=1524084 RepID=A0A7W9LM92_9ACTN|nr:hypothetical protein [Jiangella mangrovi]MBB5788939.1 hypothetical protein [Jiangella mangrovi]